MLVDATGEVERKDVLGRDHIGLHADHLGDVGDPTGTVAQAGLVDDDVNG
jgi:hypothetical protein